MTDAPAPHGLIRDSPDEHQRRKLDDALPLALNQVDEHRYRQRTEADEEGRGQKGHG